MSFFQKVLSKDDNIDVEEFLNNIDAVEEESYEDADAFVKPLLLQGDADKAIIIAEVKKGNFMLVNISDLAKRNAIKLRDMINELKQETDLIDGDIARISHDHVLITPSKVKIVKRREVA